MRVIPYLTIAAGAAAALLKGDDDCSNEAWAQCGGTGWAGDTCCVSSAEGLPPPAPKLTNYKLDI